MPSFDSDGVNIVYETYGDGDPVILCHGFAAHQQQAWQASGWHDTLIMADRKVILFDHRGHGESEKCYSTEDYSIPIMSQDVLRLMDELNISKAPIISHSMGARISLDLAVNHSDRLESVVLIGVGETLLDPKREPEIMAEALLSDSPWDIDDEAAVSFRAFVDSTESDRRALAACVLGIRQLVNKNSLSTITVPILLLGAARDELAGRVEPLGDAIAGARYKTVPRTSHHSILDEAVTKDLAFEFLGLPPPEHFQNTW